MKIIMDRHVDFAAAKNKISSTHIKKFTNLEIPGWQKE